MLLFNHILLGIVDGFCYSLVVDASTFGFRPALDEFLLTICDICGAVIKPQALRSHIGKTNIPVLCHLVAVCAFFNTLNGNKLPEFTAQGIAIL